MYERAEARIDLGALRHNCRELKSRLAGGVELCPVLKADAYGHGALHCVSAVAEAGADRIAFATASEAVLARSVVPDVPLLVLGALAPAEIEMAISARADVAAWEPGFIATLADQAAAAGLVVGRARREFPEVKLHAANSAGLIADPASHFDMVRPGVAIYGMDPFGEDPADHNLRPVLSLHSWVASVKDFAPGMSAGYGRTWQAEHATRVAAIPIGYGDGVRRGLSNKGEVLIGGRRPPPPRPRPRGNITPPPRPGSEGRGGGGGAPLGRPGGGAVPAERVGVAPGAGSDRGARRLAAPGGPAGRQRGAAKEPRPGSGSR